MWSFGASQLLDLRSLCSLADLDYALCLEGFEIRIACLWSLIVLNSILKIVADIVSL